MSNISETLFIILAGGIGKRFAPLVTDKTLFPFLGKPLLQHTLEQIERVGGRRIIVITNKQNHQWLETYRPQHVDIQLVPQPTANGMGPAILAAETQIGDQPILVLNAIDQVSDQLFHDIFDKTPNYDYLVTGKQEDTYFPGGYLQLDGQRVSSIIEKPPEGSQPSDLVNLVFHYFAHSQPFLSLLKGQTPNQDDLYEKALNELMQQKTVGFIPYTQFWHPLKFPHNILDLVEHCLHHKLVPTDLQQDSQRLALQISDRATITGPVQFGNSVVVESGATIKGPCYIGNNTIIGTNSLIRSSIIEADSIIGFGSEVARSYIGPNCKLHHNFVGDSILERECNPSWGTCFANWRFDNQDIVISYPDKKVLTNRNKFGSIVAAETFFGINCSCMPGTTVAHKTLIFPGLCVKGALSGTIKQPLNEINSV